VFVVEQVHAAAVGRAKADGGFREKRAITCGILSIADRMNPNPRCLRCNRAQTDARLIDAHVAHRLHQKQPATRQSIVKTTSTVVYTMTTFEPSLSASMRASSHDTPSMADQLPSINFGFEELRSRMNQFTTRFDDFIEKGRRRVLEERNQFRMNVAELQGMLTPPRPALYRTYSQ
jgi:hypothetical protein